jgi:hypothetical protein
MLEGGQPGEVRARTDTGFEGTPEDDPAWTCQSRDELVELLSTRFGVVAEVRADDYESLACPMIAFKPLG